MKTLFTLLILLIIGQNSMGQIKVSGTISDSTNSPLILANIIAKDPISNNIITYSITDYEGHYEMELKQNGNYNLEVSYVGMETKVEKIENLTKNKTVNIVLFPNKDLDEIELVYKMPISIRGDTISYNADHFSNGDEEVLGDVLKKLPGVEVEENGDIKVNGKSVGKVMVEGKDFFDGDTKLATKNIPADALEEIEVLRNHDDIAMMKGIRNNEDNIAINIKLKEGKKNFWFGDMSAGLGELQRHIFQTNLFYYSPKYTLNFIGNMNNVGDTPISFKDYLKFSGGFQSLLSNEGNAENLGDDPFFRLTHANNRVFDNKNTFGGLNYSYSPNEKTTFTGFMLYSKNKIESKSIEDKSYSSTIPGVAATEQTVNESKNDDELAMLKLKVDYKPKASTHLNYTLNARYITQENEALTNSTISRRLDDNTNAKRIGFQQNLKWYQTINKKNVFTVAGSFSIEKSESDDLTLFNERSRFGFGDLFNIDTTMNSLNLNQDREENTTRAEINMKYWRILGKHSQLEFGLGSSLKYQRYETGLYQGITQLTSDEFITQNDLNYDTWDRYTKIGYRWKNTKLTIQPELTFHSYDFGIEQFNKESDFISNKLLKSLSFRYKLNNNQNLNASYKENVKLMSLNRLAEGINFQSYNSIYRGNANLDPFKENIYQLGYSNFNQFYNYSLFANILFSQQNKIIASNIENHANNQGGINQISTSENIDENQNNLNASVNFSKTKGKFIIKGEISGNRSEYYQNFDNKLQNNKTLSWDYKASVRTNFKEYPNFELGYSESRQRYDQNSISTDYKTIKPYIKFSYRYKKSWLFSTDYTYNDFSTEGRNINTFSGLNASLKYQKKDNPWSFSISATNLLNNDEISTNYASVILISNTTHFVMPRYIWCTVKYKL